MIKGLLSNKSYSLYFVIAFLYVFLYIFIRPQEPAVFLLYIFSIALICIHLRFHTKPIFLLIDLLLYAGLMVFFEEAIYLMVPTLFYLTYHRMFGVNGLFIIGVLAFNLYDNLLALLYFNGMVFAVFLRYFYDIVHEKTLDVDQLREKSYDLELEHEKLIKMQSDISRHAALKERDRIASKLHDDLGHSLTGALLALRAYEAGLYKDQEKIKAVHHRLDEGLKRLKETVHQTKSEEIYGLEQFKQIINDFDVVAVKLMLKGNLLMIPSTYWHHLQTGLKEALTNVVKHADASEVSITLEVTDQVVRMICENDGLISQKVNKGQGIHYMRKRYEALGGYLSYQTGHTFKLIVTLPLSERL